MNEPEEYWILSDQMYLNMVKKMDTKASSAKASLLEFTIPNTNSGTLVGGAINETGLLEAKNILNHYKDLIFYPDAQIIDKLKALGFKKHVSSWFVPIANLNAEFSEICSKGIKVDRHIALIFIHAHLCIKFHHDISIQLMPYYHDNVVMTKVSHEIIKLTNRRKYSGADPKRYKNILEHLINTLLNDNLHCGSDKISEKELLQISRGKTNNFILKNLINECFSYDAKLMTSTKFYSSLYNLLALILPDRDFPTEEDFHKKESRIFHSYPNFDKYKAQKIRTILKASSFEK